MSDLLSVCSHCNQLTSVVVPVCAGCTMDEMIRSHDYSYKCPTCGDSAPFEGLCCDWCKLGIIEEFLKSKTVMTFRCRCGAHLDSLLFDQHICTTSTSIQ